MLDDPVGPGPVGPGPAARSRALPTLLGAAHPAPSFAVAVLVTALAAASGRSTAGCLLVALAVLTGQLSIGWSNDWIDVARDTAARRRDKPLVSGALRTGTVAVAAGCALALCVPLSLASGLLAGAAHLAGVAAGWCYNLGAKRTALSWLPYALGFGLLPAFVALGLPGRPWPPVWLLAAGALLGVGAHVTNVLPDIDADARGEVRAGALAALALLGASAALVLGPPGDPGVVGWAGLGVTGALAVVVSLPPTRWTAPDSRAPFLATLGLAGVDVALLLLRGAAAHISG
jgi:4-hydroxybenzoate polyprenyltransferase